MCWRHMSAPVLDVVQTSFSRQATPPHRCRPSFHRQPHTLPMNGIQTPCRQTPTNLKVVNKPIKPPPTLPHSSKKDTPPCWMPGVVCVCVGGATEQLVLLANGGLSSKSTQKHIADILNTFVPPLALTLTIKADIFCFEKPLILIRHF